MASNASRDDLIDVVVRLPRSTLEESIRTAAQVSAHGKDARVTLAKALLESRRKRHALFGGMHFSDPAWDMMLELYVAAASDRKIRVSKLFGEANTSPSTALRYFESLENKGMVSRVDDPFDGRSSLAEVEPKLNDAMDIWLSSLLSLLGFDQS